jgi:hypothetical protein
MRYPRKHIVLFSGLLLLCLGPAPAWADTTVTLSAVDSGWYKPDGSHDAANDNYIAG